MNAVQPYDWKEFFRERVYEVEPKVPEDGITRGGYRLVYNDTEPDSVKHMDRSRPMRFDISLGFSVTPGGEDDTDGGLPGSIPEVLWDGPAFKAGITPGMRLQAVNNQAFSIANLHDAIVSAEHSSAPIKLLLKRDKEFTTVMLDYHGGLRYPHLEKVGSTPDLLDSILDPVK
jgi:predicted metalloprotease with PDZ domain